MSGTESQTNDVIAKEITIAVVEKSNASGDELIKFACEAYKKILKVVNYPEE